MKISDTKKLATIMAAFFFTATAFSGCSESANSSQTTSSISQAAKSLKAGSEVNISGGDFKIDSADDSVHSNGNIVITRGTLIACGAVGMEEGFGDNSTQYSVLHDLGSPVFAHLCCIHTQKKDRLMMKRSLVSNLVLAVQIMQAQQST